MLLIGYSQRRGYYGKLTSSVVKGGLNLGWRRQGWEVPHSSLACDRTSAGVCFRAWTAELAETLKLDGWVRNRRDGSVEALISRSADAVARMVSSCHQGRPMRKLRQSRLSRRAARRLRVSQSCRRSEASIKGGAPSRPAAGLSRILLQENCTTWPPRSMPWLIAARPEPVLSTLTERPYCDAITLRMIAA